LTPGDIAVSTRCLGCDDLGIIAQGKQTDLPVLMDAHSRSARRLAGNRLSVRMRKKSFVAQLPRAENRSMTSPFTITVKNLIKKIPRGKV
jgi:adenine deaminase